MAEGFKHYHIPQQSRREKFHVLSQNQTSFVESSSTMKISEYQRRERKKKLAKFSACKILRNLLKIPSHFYDGISIFPSTRVSTSYSNISFLSNISYSLK